MKLSIITINYNNAVGLETTILSIVEQSFQDFEYLVIDGGSTDGSVQIIEKYKDKISVSVSEPDSGVYNAMNKGIKMAHGEYLLFINSGDTLFEKDTLQKVFAFPFTTDLVYGDLARTFPDETSDFVPMPDVINTKYLLYGTLTHPTTFIKRNLFDKYGLYREDLKIVSDWAFFLKLMAFTNITRVHIPVTIATFSMDGLSTLNKDKALEERKKVIIESFSFEILEMFELHEKYQSFYQKRIFSISRRFSAILKSVFRPRYWSQLIHRRRMNGLISIFNKTISKQKKNPLSIPIIIINYNRLADLEKLVDFLLKRKHTNIVIVDNQSTYPPLLAYYEQIKDRVTIEHMTENYGHLVFWKNEELQERYAKGYYVVTDSDIIPNESLPLDYVSQMKQILDTKKHWSKVGFALRLDDIPDHFKMKEKVLDWERKFWADEVAPNLYQGNVDTTFALYPPRFRYDVGNFLHGGRIAGNFTARHGGWYIDNENMTDEELYYFQTANASNSWKVNKEGELESGNEYR